MLSVERLPTARSHTGVCEMQSARPRDLGALALVIGLFAILLIVTLMVGTPA